MGRVSCLLLTQVSFQDMNASRPLHLVSTSQLIVRYIYDQPLANDCSNTAHEETSGIQDGDFWTSLQSCRNSFVSASKFQEQAIIHRILNQIVRKALESKSLFSPDKQLGYIFVEEIPFYLLQHSQLLLRFSYQIPKFLFVVLLLVSRVTTLFWSFLFFLHESK